MRRAPDCSWAPHRRHSKPSPDADLNSARGERSVTDYRRCQDIPGVRRPAIVQARAIPMHRGVAGIDQAAGHGEADHDSKRHLPKSRRRTESQRGQVYLSPLEINNPVPFLLARARSCPSQSPRSTRRACECQKAGRPSAHAKWPLNGSLPVLSFPLPPQATPHARVHGTHVRVTRAARHPASGARD